MMEDKNRYMFCCDCGYAFKRDDIFIKAYTNTAICLCRECALKLAQEITDKEEDKSAEIIFNIIMQLFGHKVDCAASNITKEEIEKNKKMWEKAAEELNERRIMEQKRKIAELKEQIAKNGNGKVQLQECNHTSYECMPGCCECEWIEQKKGN